MNSRPHTVPPETLTHVEFMAYDKESESFFFDATEEQCSNYIWKHICHTAVIKRITVYPVLAPKCVLGFKKKLTDEELFNRKKGESHGEG